MLTCPIPNSDPNRVNLKDYSPFLANFYPYINPTPNQIPLIGLGNHKKDVNGNSIKYYRKDILEMMVNCGLNIAMSPMREFDDIKTSVENAQSAGIKLIVRREKVELPVVEQNDNESEEIYQDRIKQSLLAVAPCYDNSTTSASLGPLWLNYIFGTYLSNRNNCWIQAIKSFGNKSCIAGWCLVDEPQYSTFWGLSVCKQAIDFTEEAFIASQSKNQENLASTSSYTKHMVFNNMFGYRDLSKPDENSKFVGILYQNTGSNKIVSGYETITSYSQFLDEYVAIFNPSFIAFDRYLTETKKNVTAPGTTSPTFSVVCAGNTYVDALKVLFEKQKEWNKTLNKNIPYWSYISCVTNDSNTWHPTLPNIKYQCFAALACGAKGIAFWEFCQEKKERPNAPIDLNGETTDTYDWVKETISQIKTVENILCDSIVSEIKNIDNNLTIKNGYEPLSFGCIVEMSIGFKNVGFTAAIHSDGTHNYLILVNKSLSVAQYVNIKFSQKVQIISTTPSSVFIEEPSNLQPLVDNEGISSFSGTIIPGQWLIFRYDL